MALPTGTVTFLFTDIEGSTRIVQDIGDAGHSQALADQRRLLRAVFETPSGGGGV
jgi:class 3 adenylate cyclase